MGSRICVMNAGRVVQIGAPLDVYWKPADTFVARFLGSPPMNLVDLQTTATRQAEAPGITAARSPAGPRARPWRPTAPSRSASGRRTWPSATGRPAQATMSTPTSSPSNRWAPRRCSLSRPPARGRRSPRGSAATSQRGSATPSACISTPRRAPCICSTRRPPAAIPGRSADAARGPHRRRHGQPPPSASPGAPWPAPPREVVAIADPSGQRRRSAPPSSASPPPMPARPPCWRPRRSTPSTSPHPANSTPSWCAWAPHTAWPSCARSRSRPIYAEAEALVADMGETRLMVHENWRFPPLLPRTPQTGSATAASARSSNAA